MLLMRKYDEENSACLLSHPVRGAWIEMETGVLLYERKESHPVRGAWIEIRIYICSVVLYGSHPVRGAWIEILQIILRRKRCKVAPRQGCVD